MNSSAVWKRSVGSLASAVRMSRSIAVEIPGWSALGCGTGSVAVAIMISWTVTPLNGLRPMTIS